MHQVDLIDLVEPEDEIEHQPFIKRKDFWNLVDPQVKKQF